MNNTTCPTCSGTDLIVIGGIVRCNDIACDTVVDDSNETPANLIETNQFR